MVRRWSYISSTCPVKVNPKFLGVYFRKSFKSTVRFKRFSKTYSKISRKKYNLRKLSNSNFNLLMYSYSWIKYYKKNIVRNSLRQLESLYLSRIVSLGSHLQGKSNAIIESKRTNSKLVSLKLTSSLSNNFIFFHQNTIFALLSTKFNIQNLNNSTINSLYFSRVLHFTSLVRRMQVLLVAKNTF